MESEAIQYYTCAEDMQEYQIDIPSYSKRVILKKISGISQIHDSDNVVIFTDKTIDVSRPYLCIFKKYNKLSDLIISESLCSLICENQYICQHAMTSIENLREDLCNIHSSVLVAACLYSYEICILVPADGIQYIDLINERVNQENSNYRISNFSNSSENNNNLDEIKSAVSSLRQKGIFRNYPNFKEYEVMIDNLLSAETVTSSESLEYYLIAALMFRTVLMDIRLRWTNEFGELHYEDAKTTEFYDNILLEKEHDLNDFLHMSHPKSIYRDLIWSVMFVTRALLTSIMERNPEKVSEERKAKHPYLFQRNDFFGFIPVIRQSDSLVSYYRDHLSPSYNYGYLAIPIRYVHSFWNFFPAYIHEFFHYISPSNRGARNEAILELTMHAVLNPLCTHLCNPDSPDANAETYTQIHRSVCSYLSMLSNIMETSSEDVDSADSMYYLFKAQCLEKYDFETIFYNSSKSHFESTPGNLKALSTCSRLWSNHGMSYFRTFASAFREIRSDISMIYMLWGDDFEYGLARYISILASEPNFAQDKADLVGDSMMLRFGFVTRYLVFITENKKEEKDIFGEKLYYKWRDKVLEVANALKKALETNSCDFASSEELANITAKKIDNLFSYVDEYANITISKNDGYFVKKWDSLFENILYPQMFGASTEQEGLVQTWENDIKEIACKKFPNELSRIYNHYEKSMLEGNFAAVANIEYNSRIVFRKLFEYFPDADL